MSKLGVHTLMKNVYYRDTVHTDEKCLTDVGMTAPKALSSMILSYLIAYLMYCKRNRKRYGPCVAVIRDKLSRIMG